ncbi:hypothetical protein H5410_013080 [Solanum commersonii]|uniref:Uncharacterized protein n=1 Tax=Solanum commersonii TaxID=4109 RepID=A0A9J6ATI5_SOLCO|nr:hypothetical protein H5410_013080 [Solanum commersonii]
MGGTEDQCSSHSQKRKLEYLSSSIHEDDGIDDDVTHCIGAGNVLPRCKDKFYRVVIRPTLLYGAECWLAKNVHVSEDEGSRHEDVHIDERSYMGQGGNGLRERGERSKTEMIRAYKDKVRGCASKEV